MIEAADTANMLIRISIPIILLLVIVGEAKKVDLCGAGAKGFPIRSGEVKDGIVYKTLRDMRSRAECVTYCVAERENCKMAFYEKNGRCQLLQNYPSFANISFNTSTPTGDIIVIDDIASADDAGCPHGCSEGSVCLLDCSAEPGFVSSGCMKTTTEQYETHQCQHYPKIQFKEYRLNNFWSTQTAVDHTYFILKFKKMLDWTALRVYYRGPVAGARGVVNAFTKWSILFNGVHCINPGPIDAAHFQQESDNNHTKTVGVEGICYDLPAGINYIKMSHHQLNGSMAELGLATSNTSVYVEELGQSDDDQSGNWSCPHLSSYNHRIYFNNETNEADASSAGTTLMSWSYSKKEEDTMLKINWNGVIGLNRTRTGRTKICAAWHIEVDDTSCSPEPINRPLTPVWGSGSLMKNEYANTEIEGYCEASRGEHDISLKLYSCTFDSQNPLADARTGYHGVNSRMMIEEIRLGTDVVGVMAPDNTIHRIPQFNYYIKGEKGHAGSGADNGVVWTFTYTKKYSTSGLRLTFNGDGRVLAGCDCCRHFFTIQSAECLNPGTIEGVHINNQAGVNYHRAFLMDGICEGISAGNLNLGISAGRCQGYGNCDCWFGWNTYFNVLAAETYVDREIMNF